MKKYITALTASIVLMSIGTSSAQTIGRANNTNAFDTDAAWTGGVAPTSSQLAGFSSINTATSATSTITAGVNFQIGGITFTNNPGTNLTIAGGSGSSLTLGGSGINLTNGNVTLTIATTAPVTLSANQTWTTGTSASGTSQLVANGIISGSGRLTINGTSGSDQVAVFLNGVNTFTGGVVLNNGGSLRISSGTAAFNVSNQLVSSSIGTGNLTINGGTIFSAGGTIAPTTITVNNDFNVNFGTNALNGRLRIGGSSIDLAGGNRTISLGRFTTALNALNSGQESLGFIANIANGPTVNTIGNGTLRLVRGSTGGSSDYVSVNFNAGNSTLGTTQFTNGAGLTIGQNVITTMATGNPFGTVSGDQPRVTVESGGYFNMSDATNARNPVIRTLEGSGTVTSLANAGAPTTSTLTINAQSGDYATFSGNIVNGSSLNGALGTSAANVSVALTKNGQGTQVLSGTNTYTGATAVNAGTLVFANTAARSSGTTVTAAAAGTVGLGVGGSGFYNATDVSNLFSNTLSGFSLNSSSGVAVDTSAGNFTQDVDLAGSRALTKLGANSLNLTGNNSYTGSTNVNAGTLLVNGSITGTGNVSVAVGATLGGNGTIAGDTVVNGTLSAGNSPGLLTFNNAGAGFADLTLASTSNSIFEINGTGRGTTYDAVNVEGILTLGGTLTVDFGFTPLLTDTFDLFNFASVSGSFSSVVFADPGYVGSFDSATGVLSLSAIPEPSTYALLLGGVVALAALRRRTKKDASLS